jgi:signal transduction histidine kinase
VKLGVRIALVIAGALAVGLTLSILLFVGWLHAPRSHVIAAIQYLVTSGVVSLAAGGSAMVLAARFVPSLGAKIAIASLVGSVAGMVNVMWTPLLMFSERSDRDILLITMLYFLTISCAFAFLVASITSRQIQALHEGALRLASGEFETEVRVQGVDELADLGRAFNRMSFELGASFARERQLESERRDLIAAVSHDLRTPLTSIRAMIEAINDGVVTDSDAVKRYLGLIQHESEHLGRLIEDLFELVRIDSGNLELRLAVVPLADLVAEVVDAMRAGAELKGVTLIAACDDVPGVAVDAPRMQRVLTNLIGNAVRHTPPGGQVNVAVRWIQGHVQVEVADTGEGIALEDQAHVFDRFYRGEKSRSRESGGAGLGLAIARGIVEAHRGHIRLESQPGHGARFIVEL